MKREDIFNLFDLTGKIALVTRGHRGFRFYSFQSLCSPWGQGDVNRQDRIQVKGTGRGDCADGRKSLLYKR